MESNNEIKEYKVRKYQKALEKLADRNGGELSAEVVVSEARKSRSPLHDAFEWNDARAAEEFRLEQARRLIRTCFVVVRDEVEPDKSVRVRAFEHVDGSYRRIEDVMQNASWRKELMNRLAHEVSLLRARYQNISSLQSVYQPVDEKLAEAEERAEAS